MSALKDLVTSDFKVQLATTVAAHVNSPCAVVLAQETAAGPHHKILLLGRGDAKTAMTARVRPDIKIVTEIARHNSLLHVAPSCLSPWPIAGLLTIMDSRSKRKSKSSCLIYHQTVNWIQIVQ